MQEGLLNSEYFIFFSQQESDEYFNKYQLSEYFSECILIGIKNWEEFILADGSGNVFLSAMLPLNSNRREEFSLAHPIQLTTDSNLAGKLKWHIQPLLFGGSTEVENITWVTIDQHVKLVAWWNERYLLVKGNT